MITSLTDPESANVIFAWFLDMTGLEKVALSSAGSAESAAGVRPTCTTDV